MVIMVSMEKHKHTSHIPYAYPLAQIRLNKYLPGVKKQEVRENTIIVVPVYLYYGLPCYLCPGYLKRSC